MGSVGDPITSIKKRGGEGVLFEEKEKKEKKKKCV